MQQSSIALYFILALLICISSGTFLSVKKQHERYWLTNHKNQLFQIPLTRVDITPKQKSQLFNKLSESHDDLLSTGSKSGGLFLQNRNKLAQSFSQTNVAQETKHHIFRDSQYLGEITVGPKNDIYKVIFDTGSANIWIDSMRCRDTGCRAHKQYNWKQSPSFAQLGYDLHVHFGNGELIGKINTDNVIFAGLELPKQSFAEITHEVGNIFAQSAFDGIVGLAYPSMAAEKIEPLFDSIINHKKLEYNVFSFFLDKNAGSQKSRLILGGVDSKLYNPPLIFFPVIDKHFWSIRATNILVNDRDIGLCNGGCTVVADTGTSLVTGPSESIKQLMKVLNIGSECKRKDLLPTIKFIFDEGYLDPVDRKAKNQGKFVLTPDDYILSQIDDEGQEECSVALMPLDVPEPHGPLWILGDIFLSKYYSVYDRDNDVLGFAQVK